MTSRVAVLFWVQHLLGTGHLRRALTLSQALVDAGFAVVLASGGRPGPWPAPAGVDMLQLPPLEARDDVFSGLVDEAGAPPGQGLWDERRRMLLEALHQWRPVAVMTEMYPFGRRAFRHEITALLDEAGRLLPRPMIVASVRDVLVRKSKPERWAAMRDIAASHYNLILVHSDERILPFSRTFPHADDIGSRIVHTGFVQTQHVSDDSAGSDAVVVSAGGGAVGARLLSTALAARPLTKFAQKPWRLVGGANLPPSEFEVLKRAIPPGVSLDRHRPDLPSLMASADVAVSQAGYNTVVEGLAGKARMVLVPFDADGQDEQQARGGRLAELGLATMVSATGLAPSTLAQAIDRAAELPRPDTSGLGFDGGMRTACEIRNRLARHASAG